jgi:hypothetical protein
MTQKWENIGNRGIAFSFRLLSSRTDFLSGKEYQGMGYLSGFEPYGRWELYHTLGL